MGVLFSPANPLYGTDVSRRICSNGQKTQDTKACQHGATVWYSDWRYRENGKIHARFTFNPYFDWQTSVMANILGSGSVPKPPMNEVKSFAPNIFGLSTVKAIRIQYF